ncbi:omega-6 fatty acid desaturase (delta-12 desaturase) [Cryptococcus neoformans c45]|nr:omega-6 fatty acid desaturase (delta-12 desaturase) [Cryptococcus neoformans var. grubii c45]
MTSTLRQRAVTPPAGQVEKDQLLREAEEKEISQGQQFIVPNFTIKQLLDAIPAHCYKRSALRSSLYVVQDAVIIAALVYGAFHIDSFLGRFSLSPVAYYAAKFALWSAYWFITGLFGTGIWVIAHEAGHQAYSSSKAINNAVGWVLHSALLVPYHSWRISHGRHHAATGHLTRDEVFVPRTRKQLGYPEVEEEGEILGINVSKERQNQLREALEDSPIVVCYNLFLQQLFGWPMYLIRNASGQLHYPEKTNHFSPHSFIFKANQYWQIVWSDIGIVLVFAALTFWASQRGIKEVATIYGIPYLWVNHWLVFITFLQHTDPILPHYSANKWTFSVVPLLPLIVTFWVLLALTFSTVLPRHTSPTMFLPRSPTTTLGKLQRPSKNSLVLPITRVTRTCLCLVTNVIETACSLRTVRTSCFTRTHLV